MNDFQPFCLTSIFSGRLIFIVRIPFDELMVVVEFPPGSVAAVTESILGTKNNLLFTVLPEFPSCMTKFLIKPG